MPYFKTANSRPLPSTTTLSKYHEPLLARRRQVGQTPNMRIKTICRDRRASGKVGIGVFFKALSFQQQEGIGQADQGHLMMPALPAAPFVMIHSQFFFELLIILLHPPAQLRQSDQAPQRDLL